MLAHGDGEPSPRVFQPGEVRPILARRGMLLSSTKLKRLSKHVPLLLERSSSYAGAGTLSFVTILASTRMGRAVPVHSRQIQP